MSEQEKKFPKLIGPPKSAHNGYVYSRLEGDCIECECCGEQWHYPKEKKSGVNIQVNIGGRVMAIRRAMYMAAFPHKVIQKTRRITSKCKNENCINPTLLIQATASELLKSQYSKGIRDRHMAAAHLLIQQRKNQKLTDSEVILVMLDERASKDAANEYGISREHYNAIRRGGARQSRSGNPFAGLGKRA
ncbi:MAG: hypothetical protein WC829_02955 [Hyphomicrobium sp.]|jgi:hypothetical protein